MGISQTISTNSLSTNDVNKATDSTSGDWLKLMGPVYDVHTTSSTKSQSSSDMYATNLTNSQSANDVNKALELTDTYTTALSNKVETITNIITNEQAKTWGITNQNIQRVIFFVGAATSGKFLWDKGLKHKWPLLGLALALYVYTQNSKKQKLG